MHSFSDGNWRTVRLICTFPLIVAGYVGFFVEDVLKTTICEVNSGFEQRQKSVWVLVVEELTTVPEIFKCMERSGK